MRRKNTQTHRAPRIESRGRISSTVDATPDRPASLVSSGVFYVKMLFSPLPSRPLARGRRSSRSEAWASLCLPGAGVVTHLEFYKGHLSLLHLFAYSVIFKYQFKFVDIYFTHWVIIHYNNYNTILFILF